MKTKLSVFQRVYVFMLLTAITFFTMGSFVDYDYKGYQYIKIDDKNYVVATAEKKKFSNFYKITTKEGYEFHISKESLIFYNK